MKHHYKSVGKYLAYYMHLDTDKVIKMIRYRYKGKGIVYYIRCRLTGQMYIGHTLASALRFHGHFISGLVSNNNLQEAMKEYGLSNFVLYVVEEYKLPQPLNYEKEKAILYSLKQKHIDKYPEDQLYNTINAIRKT